MDGGITVAMLRIQKFPLGKLELERSNCEVEIS